MSIKPFLKLMKNNQLLAMAGSKALLKPFYQLNYLAAAKECGLFELLLDAPKDFEQLAELFCKGSKAREALEAWLGLGVQLGYLGLDPRGYALKGLAKKLALPQNDAALALLQEAAGLHSKLISQTVRKLRNGELWNLEDQDGEIIARSSRIMEAFQTEAIDRFFPSSGVASLLEIGCGSGFYIKYAANRNPLLRPTLRILGQRRGVRPNSMRSGLGGLAKSLSEVSRKCAACCRRCFLIQVRRQCT